MKYTETKYSTTKRLTKDIPIITSSTKHTFKSSLFLPKNKDRMFEGGLRLHGYFKKSSVNKLLISIITVVYNGEKFLEDTISSVINQSYGNVEYIIIDGGSNDGTVEIIKKYDHLIDYWVSEADKGIYDAMNKGISLATGSWVGLVNADDFYDLNALNALAYQAKNYPEVNVFHFNLRVISFNNENSITESPTKLHMLYKGMCINHPASFVSLKTYKKEGVFSLQYPIAADWELMLRFYKNGCKFKDGKDIVSNFRLGGVSYLITKQSIKEKHLIRKKHNLFTYIDKYYLSDLVKYFVFGKNLVKVAQFKNKWVNKFKY